MLPLNVRRLLRELLNFRTGYGTDIWLIMENLTQIVEHYFIIGLWQCSVRYGNFNASHRANILVCVGALWPGLLKMETSTQVVQRTVLDGPIVSTDIWLFRYGDFNAGWHKPDRNPTIPPNQQVEIWRDTLKMALKNHFKHKTHSSNKN